EIGGALLDAQHAPGVLIDPDGAFVGGLVGALVGGDHGPVRMLLGDLVVEDDGGAAGDGFFAAAMDRGGCAVGHDVFERGAEFAGAPRSAALGPVDGQAVDAEIAVVFLAGGVGELGGDLVDVLPGGDGPAGGELAGGDL